ncbi:MAG: hypothetical protein ACT4PX_00080 [Actinomycetota bacterium]
MSRSTVPAEVPLGALRRARMARRAFLTFVAVFVALGAVGVFGVRTGTARSSGGGYTVEVRYPEVARPGLSVPWSVTVHRRGGFDGPITLASTASYFDLFDENSLDPDPSSSTSDGERVLWEFETPDAGDTVEVSLDTRMGPNVQWGARGETAVLVDGEPVASVAYRTWVMP